MNNAWTLFLTFLKIGLCSFGGGYAIIPLIQEQVAGQSGWISEKMFTDIVTISQMTPGPLAVNTSTFVGLQAGGIAGAVSATLGCVLCGIIISLLLYRFFQTHSHSACVFEVLNGLKSASLGLIVSAAAVIVLRVFFGDEPIALSGMDSGINWTALCVFTGMLFLLRRWKVNPVFIMVISGITGLLFYM